MRDPRPDPVPPRGCRKGYELRNGKCYRLTDGTSGCPSGTIRKNGRCISGSPAATVSGEKPPLPEPALSATDTDSPFEPDEVLVEISGTAPQQTANRLINAFSLTTLSSTRLTMLGTNLYRFRIGSGQTVEQVVTAIAREPGVETSQPNWRYRLNQNPPAALPRTATDDIAADRSATAKKTSDPWAKWGARKAPQQKEQTSQPQDGQQQPLQPVVGKQRRETLPQYALGMIDASDALRISRGQGVLVAIIDTGIDEKHPELEGTIAAHFNAFPSKPLTPDRHATGIAGIITAKNQLAGIAPDARVLAIQAFTPTKPTNEQRDIGGAGTSHRIVVGLNWALMKGARVVNMSFAGPKMDAQVARLIVKGNEAGVVFVAAAGNGGPTAPAAFPAAHPSVIAVTAIDSGRQLYRHANLGRYVDLAAPGVDIMAASPGGNYDLSSGTSFAAAHVSAVAALLLAKSSRLDREKLLSLLTSTATDLGPPGRDEQFGAGCVNALRALTGQAVLTSGQQ
ncbi:MAG: S8 family serine peptidase [Hyphomicrobiaceae bacterium]|nr:S8 family serine peptidase [Hyphomicrobiaceae bacterium]MCC0010836.1 S8 family serine peptidase [Hyphomicrobiaceae bacterium]